MRSNPIRFTGMASGMDTDSIVRDMLRPQQYKIDKEKKAQALIKLKQDAWKDMNKKLFDFHTKMTDKMRFTGTFSKTVITSSNDNAISIDGGATVPEGTHAFEVKQLAESISVATKLENRTLEEEVDFKFKIKGKDQPDGKEITIKLNAGQTLEDVAKLVSAELKKNGFSSNYSDSVLFVNSAHTGAQEKINIEGTTDKGKALLKELGLIGSDDKGLAGKDAIYKYNGAKFESATNKIDINGIKATLKAVTTQPVTISAERDTDAIYDFVKEFVTEYNNLIDEINTKISTKPGKDIMPLTAEERDAMSESEIKLWEDKLNSSLFYKDPQLQGFVNSARNVLGGKTDMQYNSETKAYDGAKLDFSYLSQLGIVTGPWQEGGKLHIMGDPDDELFSKEPNKLKAAIADNPQGVTDFLTTVGNKLYNEHNAIYTKGNELKTAMNFYNDKAMTDKMKSMDKRIETLEERMYKLEAMHYAKFARMETLLSSLNNQSSWLAQQFGG